MQELTLEQFLAQAREVFGQSVRRIDPVKSNLRPWVPMRFYVKPCVPRNPPKKGKGRVRDYA